ncbi:MAG: hypothetical protein HY899_12865 [Deltaproteobacteria bacterium]|nr:hypothetical protein [Deltaproteobacteria bacterium]
MLGASRLAGRLTRLLVTATLLGGGFGIERAYAGSIGFRIDTDVDTGAGLSVRVALTQTGDEAAIDVAPAVEFLDERRSGEPLARFQPNQSHVWDIRLRDQPLAPGSYAVVVRVRYSDTNGYPFEITSVAPATPGGKAGPRITGAFVVPGVPVGGDIEGKLNLKRPEGRSGTFEGVLISPRGLSLTPARFPIAFDHAGNATVDLSLQNDKLLAGTSVNLFALVSGDQGGYHQTDTLRGTIRIVPAKSPLSATTFYRAAGAAAGLLLVLELIGLRRREA